MVLFEKGILCDVSLLSADLRALIEQGYRLFAGHPLSIPLGVCKCNVCCSDEDERSLATTPLRQVSSRLLSEYTNSAHGYDERSDGHVLRHFLPRYFELIALNDPPHYGDLAHCLVRLGTADYRRNWSTIEADFIDRVFDALLREKLADLRLTHWPVGFALTYPIDELITMAILGGGNVDRLLKVWEHAPDPGASAHIASLASELTSRNGAMVLHSFYLDKHPEVCLAVGQFVCNRVQAERLERVFHMLDGQPRLQKIVSDGQALIESLLPSDT